MDWLITRTDEWYTSRVCPWRMTDQINVQWNVWRFNRTMADLEPHQGVSKTRIMSTISLLSSNTHFYRYLTGSQIRHC